MSQTWSLVHTSDCDRQLLHFVFSFSKVGFFQLYWENTIIPAPPGISAPHALKAHLHAFLVFTVPLVVVQKATDLLDFSRVVDDHLDPVTQEIVRLLLSVVAVAVKVAAG